MNKNIIILLGVFMFLCLPNASEAQIWKNMGKKIEKKIEQQADRRLERKIDKTIDKGFDKVEEAAEVKPKKKDKKSDKNTKSKKGSGDDSETDFSSILDALGNMEEGDEDMPFDPGSVLKAMGLGGDVPAPQAKYIFSLDVDYEIKADKEEPMNMGLSLSEKGYLGMSSPIQEGAFVIMDNGVTHTFMKEQMAYMSMDMEAMGGVMLDKMEEHADDEEDISFKRVGSETILGYKCEIYEFEDSDGIGRISIATGLPVSDFFGSFGAMNKDAKMPKNAPTPGLPLKIVSVDKSTKETFQMLAVKVNKSKTEFDTSGYRSMLGN